MLLLCLWHHQCTLVAYAGYYCIIIVFPWYYGAIIVLLRYVQGLCGGIMVFSSDRIGTWLGPEEERALEDSAKPYVYCYIEDKKPCHG